MSRIKEKEPIQPKNQKQPPSKDNIHKSSKSKLFSEIIAQKKHKNKEITFSKSNLKTNHSLKKEILSTKENFPKNKLTSTSTTIKHKNSLNKQNINAYEDFSLTQSSIRSKKLNQFLEKRSKTNFQQDEVLNKSRKNEYNQTEKSMNLTQKNIENIKEDLHKKNTFNMDRKEFQKNINNLENHQELTKKEHSFEEKQENIALLNSHLNLGKPSSIKVAKTQKEHNVSSQAVQEIVQHIYLGVNTKGLKEFHIQFQNDVLKGASMQITSNNGKIEAHFKSDDTNICRLLKSSEGELSRAFEKKGLMLEKFIVESP